MTIRDALLPIDTSDIAQLSAEEIVDRLERFARLYERGMRPATVRAVRGDWRTFSGWCAIAGVPTLGISRDDLARFLDNAVRRGRKRTTLERYLFTIRLAHRAAELPDPTLHPEWKLIWRGITSDLAGDGRNRARAAEPLRQEGVIAILQNIGSSNELRDLRDAALICLASDTLARREELARSRVEELTILGDVGSLEIPRSKTDTQGHGKHRHVSAATLQHVQRWLGAAGITRGPMFRAVRRRRVTSGGAANVAGEKAIAAQEVARIFKRRAAAADLNATRISGHSTRVGSAQDLVAGGYTATQIARVGGWSTEAMVNHYARDLMTMDTAIADARRNTPLPMPSEVVGSIKNHESNSQGDDGG